MFYNLNIMVIPGPNQLNQGLPYLLGDQWLSTLIHQPPSPPCWTAAFYMTWRATLNKKLQQVQNCFRYCYATLAEQGLVLVMVVALNSRIKDSLGGN